MADVKWIKVCADIFDDEKIVLIETMPEADTIVCLWFKLLCLAGKQNNHGVFLLNNRIPYTDEMLAAIFRRPVNIVRMALDTFEQFEMIERINGAVTIPNWEKHQSLDAYEKKKARDRQLQQERRAKQKLLATQSSDNRLTDDDLMCDYSSDVAVSEEEKEEDKELDKEIDKDIYLFSDRGVGEDKPNGFSENQTKAKKPNGFSEKLNNQMVNSETERFSSEPTPKSNRPEQGIDELISNMKRAFLCGFFDLGYSYDFVAAGQGLHIDTEEVLTESIAELLKQGKTDKANSLWDQAKAKGVVVSKAECKRRAS